MVETQPEPVVEGPPEAQPAATLDPQVEADILSALGSLGCRELHVLQAGDATVAAVQGAGGLESAREAAEAVSLSRSLAGAAAAGELGSGLVIGASGTLFMGSGDAPGGAYLSVSTEAASAGQVSVASRKALPLLASVPAEVGGAAPEALPPAEADESLAGIASAAGGGSGFRLADGTGVVVFGMEADAASVASAAGKLWSAAESAIDSVNRVLLMAPEKTLGLGRSQAAQALVVAEFAPGLNPGLAGTETAKLVKACDQAAQA